MEIYSEMIEGDRKASLSRLKRSEWSSDFDVWEVAMFIGGRPIQRTTCRTQHEAQRVAEDFCNGHGTSGPSLLNECITNG